MTMRPFFVALCAVALSMAAGAQVVVLNTSGGRTAESTTRRDGIPALQRAVVDVPLQLTQADASKDGEVWLDVSADAVGPEPAHITLRIPLSNTGEVYGEARACKPAADGSLDLTFTAGMDEANYVHFAPSANETRTHFLLNKYLCRALAAPFHCNGAATYVTGDWSQWRLGATSIVTLTSEKPASLSLGNVRVEAEAAAFDPASCKVIAPSNGLCCVANKTTEWHCGGTPAGPGWHQVSGECFHRETGGSCKDGDVLTLR
jgi:hypothetical protein